LLLTDAKIATINSVAILIDAAQTTTSMMVGLFPAFL
jgi:hypothetical protein